MKQPTSLHLVLQASEAAIESDRALRLKTNLLSLSGMEFYNIIRKAWSPL